VDTFAFIIHPIDPKKDIARKYPFLAKIVTDWQIKLLSPYFPPVYLSEIDGIRSVSTKKQIKGWLLACPLSPVHFMELPEKRVYRKIIETGRLAEKLGADLLGLGAFTSVVGDAGITIAQALDIPVTTGDSYTVAVAVRSVAKAAAIMDIDMNNATAAIVGASGAIGHVCAELFSEQVERLILIGRRQRVLEELRERLKDGGATAKIEVSGKMEDLQKAQLILTVTSAIDAIVHPEHLRPGSVVCDVARPRDVSRQVAAVRDDVLVIDGGVVDIPGPAEFNFNFGFPPGKGYACMAETIALTLEGRLEDYTLGKEITRWRVEEITQIADKHGFQLSGFRSFERPVTDEQIEQIRQNAKKKSLVGRQI